MGLNNNTKRYQLLDSLRGIVLINMFVYHIIWDLVYIFDEDWRWYSGKQVYIWQQVICWNFIFLSGFCWSLGKRPFKRGLTVFAAGILISSATMILDKEQQILFGILSFLGSSMLLMIPLKRWVKKIPADIGTFISAALFFLMRNINSGYLGFEVWNFAKLPSWLYHGHIAAFFGFPEAAFYSADYFSLLPWFFLFLTGYFTYRLCERDGHLCGFFEKGAAPLNLLGRHSLLAYLLHQPIIYLCLSVLLD